MGGNKKWTRRAAIGPLASGGGLLLFGTDGSTQITSYRDVEVNAGDGDDAVLQFVDRSEDANVVEVGSSAVVYEIRDNVGAFAAENIAVEARVVDGKAIGATVSTESSPFEVAVSCADGASGLSGSYTVALEFEASNPEFTITASRTTESRVEVDCGLDYGNDANYRDSTNETTIPPGDNAKGWVGNPAGVNGDDDDYATLNSEGNRSDRRGANIGFALPPVRESEKYVLDVVVSDSQPGGDWVVDVVDGKGDKLARIGTGNKSKLKKGSNSFEFELNKEAIEPPKQIDLYLIFRMTSSGNNKTAEIDYFELKPAQS